MKTNRINYQQHHFNGQITRSETRSQPLSTLHHKNCKFKSSCQEFLSRVLVKSSCQEFLSRVLHTACHQTHTSFVSKGMLSWELGFWSICHHIQQWQQNFPCPRQSRTCVKTNRINYQQHHFNGQIIRSETRSQPLSTIHHKNCKFKSSCQEFLSRVLHAACHQTYTSFVSKGMLSWELGFWSICHQMNTYAQGCYICYATE